MNRNQVNFTHVFDAKVQAKALSNFHVGGRWCVIQAGERYKVVYDECEVRDGVDESEILFQSCSNCNSGTRDYSECRKEALEYLLNQ